MVTKEEGGGEKRKKARDKCVLKKNKMKKVVCC